MELMEWNFVVYNHPPLHGIVFMDILWSSVHLFIPTYKQVHVLNTARAHYLKSIRRLASTRCQLWRKYMNHLLDSNLHMKYCSMSFKKAVHQHESEVKSCILIPTILCTFYNYVNKQLSCRPKHLLGLSTMAAYHTVLL